MKKTILAGTLILIIGASLIGCAPVGSGSNFAGTWTTNVGAMNFIQNGNEITGSIQGYGGFWNETFAGTLNENGEAVFETEMLGNFTLAFDSENTFKTTAGNLSFCGIRGENMELPAGCGFSGTWIVPSKSVFLEGSTMVLKQVGGNVTGDLIGGNGTSYDSFTGTMDWGKGWRANGTSAQRGELSLWMNGTETGFEFIYGSSGNAQQLCAVREGISSAYLSSYDCKP